MKELDLLVSALPRSGTRSASIYYNVGHEKLNARGTSSCFYWRGSWPEGFHEGDDLVTFRNHIHLVRHPLKCIASMKSIVGRDHQAWAQENDLMERTGNKLYKCMDFWVKQNRAMFGDVVQMESLEELPHKNKSSGFRKAQPLTWEDLSSTSPSLTDHIKELSIAYGY